jgi:multidrug efflux pump subunit AcrA (membrane-fusion protein)
MNNLDDFFSTSADAESSVSAAEDGNAETLRKSWKTRFSRRISRRNAVIVLGTVAAFAAAAIAVFGLGFFPAQAAGAPVMQTSFVRSGDLILVTTATGSLQASAEAPLGFRGGGVLSEVLVEAGERVETGQVLARLDDTAARLQYEQARISMESLLSPAALLDAEIAAENARRLSDQAGDNLDRLESLMGTEYEPSGEDLNLARAAAALAETRFQEALNYFEYLQVGDIHDETLETLTGNQADKLKQAHLALQNAEYGMEGTVLTAPFAGTVTRVNGVAGQLMGTNPLLTLAVTDPLVVRFPVEEGDIASVRAGCAVKISFSGYNESLWTGEVYYVEPIMTMIDGTPWMIAWATIEPGASVPLYAGMTADLEIISGETRGTLLVPVAALRELAPGSYAVFVVGADDALTLTPVTIGLRDSTSVEILSGLKEGDVVSTGSVDAE